MRQVNVAPDGGLPANENDGLALFVRPDGPLVIIVCGGGGPSITSRIVLTATAPAVTREASQSRNELSRVALIAQPLSQTPWITICAQPPVASAFVTTVSSSAFV